MKLAFSPQDISLIQNLMNQKITGNNAMPGRLIFKKLRKELSFNLEESQFCLLLSSAVRSGNIEGFEGRRKVGYIVAGSRPLTKSQLANEESDLEEKTEQTPPVPTQPAPIDPQADTDPAPPPSPTKEELDKLAAERDKLAAEREAAAAEKKSLVAAREKFASERQALETERQELEAAREKFASERQGFETEREKLRAERKSAQPINAPRADIPEQAWKRAQRLAVFVGRHRYDVPMASCDIRALLDQVLQATQTDDGPIEFNGKRYGCDNMQLLERLLLCFFEATMTVGAREAAA